MRELVAAIVTVLLLLAIPTDAAAYIGPGAGLSVIGTVFGVIAAVLLAIVGFIWYPIKRLLLKFRGPDKRRPDANVA